MAEAVAIDVYKDFTVEWHCEPPEWGSTFKVVREEWLTQDKNLDTRRIFEWRSVTEPEIMIAQRNQPPKTVKGRKKDDEPKADGL